MLAATLTSAHALTINTTFISNGNDFGNGFGTAIDAPSMSGTGTLTSVFEAAADAWESVILDDHVLSLNYGWQGLGGGILGVHNLTGQGGDPHRETSGIIRFNNAFSWFADGTPTDHSEYNTFTQTNVMRSTNAGMQLVNEGNVYTDATGNALNRFDLLTVAIHEIGHALGLSGANTEFQDENLDQDIDVDFGQFDGLVIPTISGAHLNCATCSMFPSVSGNTRKLISDLDVLANATISEFRDLDLQVVPEPATMTVLALGALAAFRRRKAA